MTNNKYIFEVTIKAADSNLHSFLTVGRNINDVYYNFNAKLYNGQPIEIVEVKRKDDKIVEGCVPDLELNPDYNPTELHKVDPSDR